MSTKTTFKRIALVTVAALGFGLLSSTAPASAAVVAASDTVQVLTATIDNSSTTVAARVGQQVSISATGTIAALAAGTATVKTLGIAAAFTAQPATSNIYPTLAPAAAAPETTLGYYGVGLTAGSTVISAGSTSTGTSSSVATINYMQAVTSTAVAAVTSSTALATVTFTPTVAGTYSLTVWNENDRTFPAVSGTTSQSASASQASLSGSESYKVFTIIVSAGVASVTLTPVNTTAAKYAAGTAGLNGSLIKVSLKDAAGNAAVLAPGETVTLTPSGTGDIDQVNGSAVTSAAGAVYNLSSSNFNNSGIAWINLIDAAAEDVSLTASINGAAATSTTISFVTVVVVAAAPAAVATSGFAGTAPDYTVAIGAKTFSWKATASTGSSVGFAISETVNNGAGAITGYTTALSYDAVGAGNTTLGYASVSVTGTTTANAQVAYEIATDSTTRNTASSGTEGQISGVTNTAGVLAVSPSTVNAVAGSTTALTVTLKDLFGAAYPYQTVTATVAGKNPTVVALTASTDANGKATFSIVDANTSTAATDTVTFSAGSSVTSTISYGANAAATVTLAYPGDADTIAGTTTTDIAAGASGATGVTATVSAVVKNAAGALLAGVPVTFSVSGLTGAEVLTTAVTVYTDTTGTASTSVASYAAGKATVKATAGVATASADIYFAQATLTEARVLSATTAGNVITASVKDRYGNPIKGVTVNATRTGTGFFGTGASTATGTTDKNGVLEFSFNGEGTVTVALESAEYGQSTSVVGKVGTTAVTASAAGTATTAQTGLGAALAPAGVNSVAVAVSTVSDAATAADAAAEATDAANAATDAANAAAEAADAATAAAQDAADAVAALSTQVTEMVSALKKQITALTNLVIKIQKKVKA